MQIPLDRASPVPLSLQITRHLGRLIQAGVLQPAVKLPATRELARTLGVNRTTVATAYDALVAEGLASAHVGQGTFVARPDGGRPPAAPPPAEPLFDWDGHSSRAARRLVADSRRRSSFDLVARSHPGLISFVGAMPDANLFPTDAFRQVLNQVIKREGTALLQYHAVAGYPPLRRFLSGWLLRHGIEAPEEEILIVNGSQQGLDLIVRVLLDPGDPVALEHPTYPGAIQTLEAFQAQLLTVPLGEAGLRPEPLARLLDQHRPKFLYCQPTAQNPTGLSIPPEAGRALVELAARHRLPVVEDGFGAPSYREPPPLPLKALDPHGLVVHLGTFSKILFPGLRLGWIVASRPVMERLLALKQLSDLHTSALLQAAVFHFCQRRLLDRHARVVRAEYARRRAALLAALRRHMPSGTTWTVPDGGFSLLVTFPERVDTAALLPRALERGVAYTPGAFFFADGTGASTLRLSFSGVPVPRIEEGVRHLAETARGALRRTTRRAVGERAGLPLV